MLTNGNNWQNLQFSIDNVKMFPTIRKSIWDRKLNLVNMAFLQEADMNIYIIIILTDDIYFGI